MCIKTFQFQTDQLWGGPLRVGNTIPLAKDTQQVNQCWAYGGYRPLARFFTSAGRQMLGHKPSHQDLINAGKTKALAGQPVGKVFNAVQVRQNCRSTISLVLQITDICVGALAQNTRSEPAMA